MKKSRAITLLLAVLCAVRLTACGTSAPSDETAATEAPSETTEVTTVQETEETAAPETSEEPEETTRKEREKKVKKTIEEDIVSLSEVYSGDFKIGTALTPTDLFSKNIKALTLKHFSDSMTVGNEMKPDYVLDKSATLKYLEETGDDENPQVSFTQAVPLLDFCNENGIPMRVHTLVWHSQTPMWFFKENYDDNGEWVTPEKMTNRLENYIKNYFATLTELYPDIDFYACDVVNEAWLEDGKCRIAGSREEGNDRSAWVKVYGDNSFIEYAFTFARKYAPEGCKLYYNDYNEYMVGKMTAIYEMAESLKEKGIIDGIGMQSHLDVRTGSDAFPSVTMYDTALDTYANLGLDIQVTEIDAGVPKESDDKYFQAQAEYYKGIFESIYKHRDNISAVIFWGITDDRSWRIGQQPLLFDKDYKAKPAFYSIADVKNEAADSTDETDTSETATDEASPSEETSAEAAEGETTEENEEASE